MARTFLIPLDGSRAAESILPQLSRVLPDNGKVDLLHLLSGMTAQEGTEYLDRIRGSMLPRNPGISMVRSGDPADGILRAALEKNIDLIAMTTHARQGLSRLFLGSVSTMVVRKSQLPVLLVRPDTPAPARALQRILVPIEGIQSPCHLLDSLRLLCPHPNVEVVLLRVLPPLIDPAPQWAMDTPLSAGSSPERRLQELADSLEEQGFIAWPITSMGNAEVEILAHARKLEVDLIAMSVHGRSGVERLLEGSVSEKVLQRSPVAVLLQKPLVVHQPTLAGGSHV